MKRGLITWDREELPPDVFRERLGRVRECAKEASVAAVVVYCDVWRSNDARFLSNFMPYFNRSLLVVPVEGEPILICGLSPRVYPWIRSVTIVDDIRPGKKPANRLVEIASEKSWTRIAVANYRELPHEMYRELDRSVLEVVDIAIPPSVDANDIDMRKKALAITRPIVNSLEHHAGEKDVHIVARLERALRGAGMEDLVLWLATAGRSPRPAYGAHVTDRFSVIVGAEYRGHWIALSRSSPGASRQGSFESIPDGALAHDLTGAHPFRALAPGTLAPGSLVALHVEVENGLWFGDTCLVTSATSADIL